jgi:hypothetical protein
VVGEGGVEVRHELRPFGFSEAVMTSILSGAIEGRIRSRHRGGNVPHDWYTSGGETQIGRGGRSRDDSRRGSRSAPAMLEASMADEQSHESVTEEQNGQFSTVSETIPPSVVKTGPEKHASEANELLRRDAGDVTAGIVSMERSGAERVEGERVTMTSSGARTLSARTLQMENSGAVSASAERLVMQSSSALVASAEQIRLARSKAFMANAATMTAEQDVSVGWLNVGEVKASGDIRATFMMAGNVSAEGDVDIRFDAASAFALGAGFAAVLLFVRGVLRRVF